MNLGQFSTIRVGAADLNGQWRGKRVPGTYATKLDKGAVRLPLSALNADIWGEDIADSPLVFERGDVDGVLYPTDRGAVPMPWLATPSALVPMWMSLEDGTPYLGDPRHALNHVLDRYRARGWEVMAASEMEFSLVDDQGNALRPPRDPRSGRRLLSGSMYSLDELDAFDLFFTELHTGCKAMDLPVQSIVNEAGIGQFEVTFNHQEALYAADDALLFKMLVRGLARKHGMAATFMAKPYAQDAGNGMHVHFSVVDKDGNNVFDNGGEEGTPLLLSAIAGCLEAMPASTLIFAPHGPSYDRFAPGAHAPTQVCWGYENRTVAIRVPGGPTAARRIEHRVAGGDVNPYLMLAVMLGAAMDGIDRDLTPPPPIEGNAYEQDLPTLAEDWEEAVALFEKDPIIARALPGQLIRNLVRTKRQELERLDDIPSSKHWHTYLERV
ncbi:glutamine synthetase family protein [Shimia biformata]|uniref:glutamine synthetase family protein n=1 Tax=Shimia biformata TaxID=1294299 RepID=UPI00194E29C3|nr:glutamine synthetase family protein [Shimia biformata]